MARVTATEVKQIMDNCTISDTIVEVMIDAANNVITKIYDGDGSMSDDMLKEIERWLTVHRQTADEKLGDAAVKFTGKWGERLAGTSYGQMVLILDVSGRMSQAGKQRATITAVQSTDHE
jgi:hypothetical protein